jgi:hypothetical protein
VVCIGVLGEKMELVRLSTTTTGTTGSATNSVTTSDIINGKVYGIYVTVPSGGTCNCTLAMQAYADNILALGTVVASAWYYPRRAICDRGGTAVSYDGVYPIHEAFGVMDHLVFSVTSATTAKTFSMDIFVDK